jgi:hypothetical protein
MKKSFLILTIFLIVISCTKKDEPIETDSCETEILALSTTLVNATNTLNSNPTQVNCIAFKTAWINVYNKLKECGKSTAELDATRATTYDSIDCSILSGVGGGSNTNGNVVFYTPDNLAGSNITVTCYGQTKTITTSTTGTPTCSMLGSAIFSLPAGTYTYTASRLTQNWSGSVSINGNGSCFVRPLIISTGGGSTTGNATFYITQSTSQTVTVNCGGQTKYISTLFPNGAPGCGANNAANFTLPAGTYNYTASTSAQNWSGSITITGNGCIQQLLTVNNSSNIGHLTVWSPNTSVSTITVTCGGLTRYVTSKYSSQPNCESSGCAIFDLPYGNYTINASAAGGYSWNPFPITINNPDQCFMVGLQ